jgi:2-iminobutanoate/2-iminopropanoate deaminase
MRQFISTNNKLNRGRPLSQAIKQGNFIFLSGQAAINPETGDLVEGFKAQTRQTIENLLEVLHAAGGKKEDLIKVNVYLRDIGYFEMFNQIYQEYFTANQPARTCVQTSLVGSFLIEIDGIALLDE